MNTLGVWLFGLSLIIGVGNSLIRKDPMALSIYRFKDHKDYKEISDLAHETKHFYGILGFAWGLLGASMLALLFAY